MNYRKKYSKYRRKRLDLRRQLLTFNITSKKYRNVWIVSGLRRSGNHLAISYLISALSEKSVYFFNDIYPKGFDGTLTQYSLDHAERAFNPVISRNIISLKEFNDSDEVRDLIISIEDKRVEYLDEMYDALKPFCKRIKKVLIMRDLLNVMASRLKHIERAEQQQMMADEVTIKFWEEYHRKSKQSDVITVNYNMFVRDMKYYEPVGKIGKNKDLVLKMKEKLPTAFYLNSVCKQLGINVQNTKITTSNYGGGSRFSNLR